MDIDQILDFSYSVYWQINRFKFDATCSQISAIFADDDPLSGLYNCLYDGIYPIQSYTGKERNTTSVEEPPPGGYYQLFDSISSPSELDPFFDWVHLEELVNWIDLEYPTNNTHYIYCAFSYPDAPSENNYTTSDLIQCLIGWRHRNVYQ